MEFDPYTTEVLVDLTVAQIGAIIAKCVGDGDTLKQRDKLALRVATRRLSKAALRKVKAWE